MEPRDPDFLSSGIVVAVYSIFHFHPRYFYETEGRWIFRKLKIIILLFKWHISICDNLAKMCDFAQRTGLYHFHHKTSALPAFKSVRFNPGVMYKYL